MLLPFLFAILLASLAAPAVATSAPPQQWLTPAQLRQDLAFLKTAIADTHPDPGFSADPGKLAAAYAGVHKQFGKPMTRDQAWRVLARLNPVFADGHLQVAIPDWREQARAHLAAGGRLFPFATHIDEAGGMQIRSTIDGGATPLAGMRIERINGMAANEVTRAMLALTPGDTPRLRASLLARRMWLTYWKMAGAPDSFELVLTAPGSRRTLRIPASNAEPEALSAGDFAQQFAFSLRPGGAGVLTVRQFMAQDKQQFYAFTRQAFEAMRLANTGTLLIDLRENTGGDDDMWKQGILPYIADKPYRHASRYVKKVIAGRASGAEQVGDIVHGQADSWVQPQPDHPLRFRGRVYVLVGRVSYSSAILFSNVVQDFGFGKLVGEPGVARARQSGGIQAVHLLPHTGLEIVVPRFILDRPSGKREPALLQPDIVLPDSPFDKNQLIDAVLQLSAPATSPAAAPHANPRP